jgi:predicted nucleic acid-binding protein
LPDYAAVNASPLIFLSRAGLLELLQIAADQIVVPEPVAEELLRRGRGDIAARAIEREPWLRVVRSPDIPSLIQSWDLGEGESSVLAWVKENADAVAIVDDLAARRCAAALGLRVGGTLGLVLLGKKRGRIGLARPVLDSLRQSGMYLSDDIMNRALELVGE